MRRLSTRAVALSVVLLVALFFGRLLDTAAKKSFTIDEPHYVATGLYIWRTGDYDWFHTLRLHPPLAFHLASVPLLALDLGGLGAHRDVGVSLVRNATSPPVQIRVASRLPFALLACWGAVLAFLWAREVAGDVAGLLAAFLFSFSPTLAAYGPLVHSDMPFAVFHFQTLYTFWRWWRAPSRGRIAACGISFGLALSVKASAVLLPFGLVGIVGVLLMRPDAAATRPAPGLRHSLLALCGIGAIALSVLWLSYGGSLQIHAGPLGPFANAPVPDYLRSLLMDRTINSGDHYFWLFGENREHAPWWTLLAAFVLKMPIPILLLALAALLHRTPGAFRSARLLPFLLIPSAVYAAVACFYIELPYGLRYLLPVYPFLVVFIATRLGDRPGPALRAGTALAAAWLAAVSVWIHPHYLSYFNELIGGPARAHAHFADSSLDWGQDVSTLGAWLAEHDHPPIAAAIYSMERLESYAPGVEPLDGCVPAESGLVAISVAVYRGVNAPDLFGRPPQGCYDWLEGRVPLAMAGYSILIFDLDSSANPP